MFRLNAVDGNRRWYVARKHRRTSGPVVLGGARMGTKTNVHPQA